MVRNGAELRRPMRSARRGTGGIRSRSNCDTVYMITATGLLAIRYYLSRP
jgi:hypothetical protein